MDDFLVKYAQIGEIFDCLSMGAIILSRDRRIISLNKSAEKLTGHKEGEIKGKYCYKILLNYLCGGKCKYLNSPDMERETLVSEIEISDEKNKKCNIIKIESPLFDQNNKICGCLEVFQDHSAFRKLIRRIRFDDLRLKIILDNLNIGIMTVDRGDHISFFNTMAEEITGYSRKEVLGRQAERLFALNSNQKSGKKINLPDKNAKRYTIESEITTKDGRKIPVQANYMPLKNEDGSIVGAMATISDLSLKYQLNSAIKDQYTFYDMVGRHPDMQRIFEIIPVVAASDATVLIEGPTGTGKDLLAKIIHNTSGRSAMQMIKVNCASLPNDLLESEMFGYVRGAFTGADKNKPGRFQLADKSTIFLDEIGDLPLALQAKLLRVIEDKEFYPLGSRQTTKVDVRIISATNQDLKKLVLEKKFREDLFYRLNVMRLELPPLKDRKSDLPILISHILKRLCATLDTHVERISEEAMSLLLNYDYPGNVRELENILEHALIICQDDVIEKKHFPIWLIKSSNGFSGKRKYHKPGGNYKNEKEMILAMLKRYRWNKGQTAKALNIDRTTLWRKMKKYDLLTY